MLTISSQAGRSQSSTAAVNAGGNLDWSADARLPSSDFMMRDNPSAVAEKLRPQEQQVVSVKPGAIDK